MCADSEANVYPRVLRRSPLDTWKQCTEFITKPLLVALVWLGTLSAKYPWRTVLLAVLTAFSFITIGILTNFHLETATGVMWIPEGSNTKVHGDWLYSEESGFPLPSRPMEILIHANGKNVLGLEGMKRVFDALDVVRFGTPDYNTICSLPDDQDNKECPISSPTAFWTNHNASLFESKIQTDEETIYELSKLKFANGAKVSRESIYGQAYPTLLESLEDQENAVALLESVSAMRLKIDLPAEKKETQEFERAAIDNLFALQDQWDKIAGNEFIIEVFTAGSFDDELNRQASADTPYIALAFNVMGIFCAIVLAKWDKVKSQSLLGVGAIVTIVLAIMTGYGLNFIIGIPFTPIVQIFPYVMVGIGLDDTFILTGEYGRTDPNKNVVDRVGDTMQKIGISVLVSTMTTFFAFLLGSVSSLPALKWFAYYAAPTVLIDFFYQATFFVALIAIDDHRQRANRRDCCPCCIVNRSTSEDGVVGEQGENINTMTEEDQNPTGKGDDRLSKMWEFYISVLMRPVMKACVLVFFAGLLVLGILGALQQSQQFDFRLLIPNDSYVTMYYNALDSYVGIASDQVVLSACYFRNIDVSKEENQQKIANFLDEMVDMEYVSSKPADNWLSDFNVYQNQTMQEENMTFFDGLESFLTTEPYKTLYQNNIVRNDAGIVTASRVYILFDKVNAYDSQNQIDAYNDQIKVAEEQPLNTNTPPKDWPIFSYGEIYKAWGLYDAEAKEIVLSVGLGIVVVFVIALIFIPHPIGAPIVTCIVAAIYIELLALLWAAGIYLNSLSALGLVMSMGLVVDYNMHMFLTYFEIEDSITREERVKKVLRTMGKSIFLGGFSTFLGILPLAMAGSEFFRIFFITFVGIATLGPAHGLVLTPVLLSLIAPHNQVPTPTTSVTEEVIVAKDSECSADKDDSEFSA
mmetsp:Transcript_19922/g.22798  ORF Transcript_19922/g.22798 Transcript_19922/m.22798 type:complete len:920 (-) Transcript_19922:122-2881(-)|eukprot:CAMPEP_0194140524 /NCGR_PEP_ID=MMETSP0152-20130528/10065_1 /TAXON_ID=1049557 /ORGANISM="Thalassiothrix antarctica, Strain L6-D1" /LENGTH=919 /DNA_ID=CAMNT_0038838807 /DNA_START=289 /DNA_END=3048 /DNA_ORIENTATION=+